MKKNLTKNHVQLTSFVSVASNFNMIRFEEELNKEQLNVVQHGDGPCLVLAGAGSGKTRAITYRVAYLLEKGIAPKNILLVTFTNKAAKEMKDRISQLIERRPPLAPPSQGGNLSWSGTFHHIGYRILRQYAPLLGYKNNFSILDSQDSLDLIKICLKQEGVNRTERRFPSAKVLLSIISYARNAETTIVDVLDMKYPNWLDLSETIGRIAAEYDKRKKEANAMDFDDLLVNTYLLLLKSERVRKKYSEQFQYVLVDEYQDTNKIQASIVKLFASHHRNILVVGDDAQSIYSFRAADIQNILDFESHYQDAKVFRLQTNYRSTPDILDVANQVIENNESQYKKELKSVIENFTKPEVHAFADNQEEAQFVAGRILELRDEGVELNKIAVLFRAAFHSQALEVELTKRDIPYEFRGGVRFFERAHIKDVLAYLKIFNNREDEIAWSRVLNMQTGIGPASVQRIVSQIKSFDVISSPEGEKSFREQSSQTERSLVESDDSPRDDNFLDGISEVLPARAKIGWNDFLQVYEAMQNELEKNPAQLIRAVTNSKYQDYLEAEYPDYRERLQDLEQLAIFAERQPDLNKFLAEASLQESYTAGQTKDVETDDEEKLILSTIHQAKGLEWEAVFVLSVAAGQFPSDRSLKEEKGIEEERRLFYVAITRAKKQLYLSYSLTGSFDSALQGPSIFIEEIDKDLLDHHFIQGGTVFTDPSDSVDDVVYEPFEDDHFSKKKRPGSFLIDV